MRTVVIVLLLWLLFAILVAPLAVWLLRRGRGESADEQDESEAPM